MATDEYERECWAEGKLLCGVDEAGFGNLFGSCFISGVIFPRDFDFEILKGLKDSKLLKDERRFALEPLIKSHALWWFCEEIVPEIIDKETAYHAKYRVAGEAINSDKNPYRVLKVIMDGNVKIKNLLPEFENESLVKGDMLCKSVSAASIISKCSQRRQIIELSPLFPQYDVHKTNGYWSKEHAEAIVKYGPTKWHRLSYLRNIKWEN